MKTEVDGLSIDSKIEFLAYCVMNHESFERVLVKRTDTTMVEKINTILDVCTIHLRRLQLSARGFNDGSLRKNTFNKYLDLQILT